MIKLFVTINFVLELAFLVTEKLLFIHGRVRPCTRVFMSRLRDRLLDFMALCY